MKNRHLPAIPGGLALYVLTAFYSALTSAYCVLGLYPRNALPDKNALFAMPMPLALLARIAASVGIALVAAALLAAIRDSKRALTGGSAVFLAFLLLLLNVAAYQADYVGERIGLGAVLLALTPAVALFVWTVIRAQRCSRVFSVATIWADRHTAALFRGTLWGRSHAFWILSLCGAIEAAGFVSVALNQYQFIEPRYDTAVFENIFWNTLHGHIGWESIDRVNHLGVHFTPTLALLLPIYAVFPHATTFLVLESLALPLAIIPLWLLVRKVTGSERVAFALSLAYLMFPHILGMNIHGFKELAFWPLLGFTFLLLVEEPRFYRNPAYWLALLLTLGLKEEFPLTLAAVSLVHWLRGRERTAHGALIVFCAIWFTAVTQVIMPTLLGPAGHPVYGKGWLFAHYYEEMLPRGARTFFGFGANAVLHPILTAQILGRPQVLKFLFDISLPLLFLPWCGGWFLLALVPNLFLTDLLALIPGPLTTLSSYITYVVPWFYAAAYGWVRLRDRFPASAAIAQSGLLFGLVLVSAMFLTQNLHFSRPISADQVTLRRWLETRPTELRVMASRCFLPLLSGRASIRSMDVKDDLALLDLIIVQSKQNYCTWVQDPYEEIRKEALATGDFVQEPGPLPGIEVFRRDRPPVTAK